MEQKKAVPAGPGWVETDIRNFRGSPAERIGEGWMLISAGGGDNWNTMTASWGGLGVLWGRNVATIYVRPVRRTFELLNTNELFTLSFFDEQHRPALIFCGSKSGRDYDKAAETGLTPVVFDGGVAGGRVAGAVAFREASEIIICRKLYTHDFDPARFLDPAIEQHYPQKDYHRLFVGEVLTLLSAE